MLYKGNLRIVFYSDASLGNLGPNKTDSGRGFIIFLVNDHGIGSVVNWGSNKIKRKVHSILGAETLSFLDAMSSAIYLRSLLSEIMYRDMKTKVIHIVGVTDSKQLTDSISSTKQCLEQRLRLDLAEIQEAVFEEDVTVKWTCTKDQLADSLTKGTADNRELIKTVESGNIGNFVF